MYFFDFFKIGGSVRNDNKTSSNNSNASFNIELEQSMKRTMERYRCVSAVLEQHSNPCVYEFLTTSKGVPVFLCMDRNGSSIEIYNLNNNPEAVCRLKLIAEFEGEIARIVQIVGGMRMGHGRLAVKRLVEFCTQSGITSVVCSFNAPTAETAETFSYFFTKLGFHVSNTERNIWEAHLRVELPINVLK